MSHSVQCTVKGTCHVLLGPWCSRWCWVHTVCSSSARKTTSWTQHSASSAKRSFLSWLSRCQTGGTGYASKVVLWSKYLQFNSLFVKHNVAVRYSYYVDIPAALSPSSSCDVSLVVACTRLGAHRNFDWFHKRILWLNRVSASRCSNGNSLPWLLKLDWHVLDPTCKFMHVALGVKAFLGQCHPVIPCNDDLHTMSVAAQTGRARGDNSGKSSQ